MFDTGAGLHLGVSLALGVLIGLERGWERRDGVEGTRVAGIRTHGLIGLTGGAAGLLAKGGNDFVIGLLAVAVAVVLVAAHGVALRIQQAGGQDASRAVSITGVVAGLLTFSLGALATSGYLFEASAAAVVTTLLLSAKTEIHGWVKALEPQELRAALKLLLISVVILPILPNKDYGPWQALNPFEIWWMVVLIAAISFSGYFAMKIAGPKTGALLTGMLAGLVSSTALTMSFSRAARQSPSAGHALSSAILLACATMPARMLVIAAVVNIDVLRAIALPCLSMSAILGAAAWAQWHAQPSVPKTQPEPALSNPLELRPAILFGALLAVIVLASEGARDYFGQLGLIVLGAVSGIADVDAINLAMSRLAETPDIHASATFAIVLAAASNNVVKGGMAISLGGTVMTRRIALPLALAAAVGLALAWWTTGIGPAV